MFKLCLLLSRDLCTLPVADVLHQALAGGVDLVQLREKEMTPREFCEYAQPLVDICKAKHVKVVVNDSVECAMAVDADGVHLGQEDMPVAIARKLLGDEKLIGLSTHNVEQAEDAVCSGADYIGFGPIYPTPTKGYLRGLGPEQLLLVRTGCDLPILAIGGINVNNAEMVPRFAGMAVSSVICGSADPLNICRQLSQSRV
ncbi:MAG: thiamine phosphate synthase [Planctomycetes bacterium]|nr:thiamine phosphate synthase [Planctomycetota bacterium]